MDLVKIQTYNGESWVSLSLLLLHVVTTSCQHGSSKYMMIRLSLAADISGTGNAGQNKLKKMGIIRLPPKS